MTEPRRTRGVFIGALLFLLLALGAGFFYSSGYDRTNQAKTEPQPKATEGSNDRKGTTGKAGMDSDPSGPLAKEATEPLRINLGETFRLKPGESAVLSFVRMERGLNGMLLVTPETTPEGYVCVETRILEVTDKAVELLGAGDLFPDILSTEHTDAIGKLRFKVLVDTIQNVEGAEQLTFPRMITKPGMKAGFRSVITNPGSSEWKGMEFGTTADPLEDGGFDISVSYTWQGDPPE